MSTTFDNQTDTTRDLWAETAFPLCTKFGLRIAPGKTADHMPGIPFEQLSERLKAVGKWGDWCNWTGGGLTSGEAGIYPWDCERFLAGLPNLD